MSLPNELLPVGLLGTGAAGGYQIERSLRFNSADSAYLSRTPASAGNRKTWTWAGWVKRSQISSSASLALFGAYSSTTNRDVFRFLNDSISFQFTNSITLTSTSLFRDLSAWYHLVISLDTTQAVPSDRVKIYVNGTQVNSFSSSQYPSQNAVGQINNNVIQYLGARSAAGSVDAFFNGYLADIHFIDGQALDPTSFGEFDANGVWQPIEYTGTYGTNGFHLPFSDNSTAAALGTDTSGNSNNWTPNNLSITTGGPTSVAAASGALPIYNTTDTYGTTKGTGTRTDSDSSSIVLALPMDGANNGTTFTDESAAIKGSGSAKTITRYNAVTSTSQSKYYGSSGYFDGTGDYLTVGSSADFAFGTGDFTVEGWVYITNLTAPSYGGPLIDTRTVNSSTTGFCIHILTNGQFDIYTNTPLAAGGSIRQDSWNHVCVTRKNGVANGYLNGSLVWSVSFTNNLTDQTCIIGTNIPQNNYLYGYIQDLRVYKGVAKYTSNFNPPSSTKNATVAAANDSLVDTPTNYGTDTGAGGEVRGNYCTMNPIDAAASMTYTNGNLDHPNNAVNGIGRGTVAASSGKYYFEYTFTGTSGGYPHIGLASTSDSTSTAYVGASATSWGCRMQGDTSTTYAVKRNNGSQVTMGSSGSAIGVNDVLIVAYDLDAGKMWFGKNGSWFDSGNPATGANAAFTNLSGSLAPASSNYGTGSFNFGQRPFAYTAPSGFKALCTTNLPEGSITTSGTFTGNSSTDGPFVYLNGVPTAMTINGNAVTFGTHADKLSNGFKVRDSTSSYNTSGSNTYSISSTGDKFKVSRAQANP